MSGELLKARHAREKGKVLLVLREEYASRMTRVGDLAGALSALGCPMTVEGLQFALRYLADEGYISITEAHQVPGWRSDRPSGDPSVIVFAKLAPLGLRLIDGTAPENAGVSF